MASTWLLLSCTLLSVLETVRAAELTEKEFARMTTDEYDTMVLGRSEAEIRDQAISVTCSELGLSTRSRDAILQRLLDVSSYLKSGKPKTSLVSSLWTQAIKPRIIKAAKQDCCRATYDPRLFKWGVTCYVWFSDIDELGM